MAKKIQLQIADPCHENWDQMTQAEKGRYCASCQKQVMDFTNMSDSQLAAFFKKPSDGSVCGRFYQDQLERDIEIPRKRIPWVKYFFQFALPAFLVSMKATAQGKVTAKRQNTVAVPITVTTGFVGVAYNPVKINRKPGCQKEIIIKGKVVDENNNPVPFATLMIKGTKVGTMADSVGVFRIENPDLQTMIILQVSSVGYEAKEILISKETDLAKDKVIQLTRQVLEEVVVSSGLCVKRSTMVMGGIGLVRSNNKTEIVTEIKPPSDEKPMIKVYPNPVLSGTNINVGCQKLKEGYYSVQLSNQSGQQVFIKQTWIDAEAQVLNIDIPTVAAGVYFLKLTNKETNKRFTAKVIVQ